MGNAVVRHHTTKSNVVYSWPPKYQRVNLTAITDVNWFIHLIHREISVVQVAGAPQEANLCHPIVNEQKIPQLQSNETSAHCKMTVVPQFYILWNSGVTYIS